MKDSDIHRWIYTDDGKGGKQDGKRYDSRHSREDHFQFYNADLYR